MDVTGVWRPLVDGSRNEVLVDVPMGPGLSGWLTTWLATQGRPTRLRDVMPYTDRGRLRVVVSADVGVPAVPAFVDRRLLDVSADQLRRALERLGVEGRVVTRLHRYMSAGDARFLLLHRPRVLAEAVEYHVAARRSGYATAASMAREQGGHVPFLELGVSNGEPEYFFASVLGGPIWPGVMW